MIVFWRFVRAGDRRTWFPLLDQLTLILLKITSPPLCLHILHKNCCYAGTNICNRDFERWSMSGHEIKYFYSNIKRRYSSMNKASGRALEIGNWKLETNNKIIKCIIYCNIFRPLCFFFLFYLYINTLYKIALHRIVIYILFNFLFIFFSHLSCVNFFVMYLRNQFWYTYRIRVYIYKYIFMLILFFPSLFISTSYQFM